LGKTSEYAQMKDLHLLDAVIQRDEGAWQELIRRFRGLIHHCINVALRRSDGVLSLEDQDEVFSEVCASLLRNDMGRLRRFDAHRGTKLGTWIGLIAIRTCYDHLRAVARRPTVEGDNGILEQEDARPGPLEQLLDRERWEQVTLLLDGLTVKERRFFDLCYCQELEPHEIARELQISIGTVYAKKNKIQNRLAVLAAESRVPLAA
jgi:RNA polymerase sigma-70 factor (ECF subfamily)